VITTYWCGNTPSPGPLRSAFLRQHRHTVTTVIPPARVRLFRLAQRNGRPLREGRPLLSHESVGRFRCLVSPLSRQLLARRVPDDDWRVRASPRDKLILTDPDCLRREYIAACFKRDAAGLAALDALGGTEFRPPPIDLGIIRFLHGRVSRDAVNQLAGMTMSGPVRNAAERDRTVIYWLLHDVYLRAQVAPARIKTEQRLRANAARKAGELAQIGDGDMLRLVREAHVAADKAEPIVGRKDPERPPLSESGAEAFQNWARQFFPEATPTWGPFLGVAFQSGDVVETPEKPAVVGRHSGIGALAVIIPALVKRRGRCDDLIANLATAAFGIEVTRTEVVCRRKVFLTQRGFQVE
jgi:hypothetical protein